jgi:hypothetical protein
MISLIFFLAAFIIWQEDFADTTPVMQQLYDYDVDVVQQNGTVKLTANPQFEGFASAWLHVDKEIVLAENDVLVIHIRGSENSARIRYFFRKGECLEYYAGEEIITASNEWKDVIIVLKQAVLFSGTEFPAALTPNKNPYLYVFVENASPGNFEIEIERISIARNPKKAEER